MMSRILGCRQQGRREAVFGLTGGCRVALALLAALAFFGGAWGCRGKADGHPPEGAAVSEGESGREHGQSTGKGTAAGTGEEGHGHGTGEEGHGHGTGEGGHGTGEEGHGTGEEGHGHGAAGESQGHGVGGNLEEAARQPCEHGVPISGCDECRYEVGLVKVLPEVAARLIDTVEVRQQDVGAHRLKLRCEAGADRQATAEVTAMHEGRVERVVRALGQRVEPGEVLLVLQSREAARVRMEHHRAHQEVELARLELARVGKVHESLRSILADLEGNRGTVGSGGAGEAGKAGEAGLGEAGEAGSGVAGAAGLGVARGAGEEGPDVSRDRFAGLPAGEPKARLLSALNDYEEAVRLAVIEHGRLAEGNRLLGRGGHVVAAPQAEPKGAYAGEWRRLLTEAREVRDLARRDLERVEGLVRSGVRSSRELDAARKDVAVAEASYRAARETVGLEVDRLEVETDARLRAARIRLEGASEEINLHLEAEIARARQVVDQAEGEEALLHRSLVLMGIGEDVMEKPVPPDSPEAWRLEVKAPVPGTVVKVNVATGGTVAGGEALMTLSDTGSAWVWCDLYPEDLAALEGAVLPLQADVDTGGGAERTLSGSLDYIERSADPHTRTVKARIAVSGATLRPGTFLFASLATGNAEAGVFLPEEAVLADGDERFVFVQWKEDLWARRDVTIEAAGDGAVRVLGGLAPEEKVAVKGAFFLKSDVLREKMGAGCAD